MFKDHEFDPVTPEEEARRRQEEEFARRVRREVLRIERGEADEDILRSGNFSGSVEKDFFGRALTPFEIITRKAVVPTAEELERNPRSRSAKLRAAAKRENE